METVIVAILTAVISGGLFTFIQFLINRNDSKASEIDSLRNELQLIRSQLDACRRDNCRTQMLVLMADYPHEQAELMRVAEYYFNDLEGDWYMTSLFNKHLEINHISKPEWLQEKR